MISHFLRTVLILSLIASYRYTYSQIKTGIATYEEKLAEDNFAFSATLYFDLKKSSYVSKQNSQSIWELRKEINGEHLKEEILTDTIGHIVVTELKSPVITVRDFCEEGQAVIYKDTIQMDWKISSDTKEIGNLRCQKATTRFRGRKYEAWFTSSIPAPFGPWKFRGLPGLILEISDSKQEVVIKLTSYKSQNLPQVLTSNGNESSTDLQTLNECFHKQWVKSKEQFAAKMAALQAQYPTLEIEIESPASRPATELEY